MVNAGADGDDNSDNCGDNDHDDDYGTGDNYQPHWKLIHMQVRIRSRRQRKMHRSPLITKMVMIMMVIMMMMIYI